MQKVLLLGYDGHYGGDLYEAQLAKTLSNYPELDITTYRLPRHGGLRTFSSLIKLTIVGLTFKGHVIRPFGLPLHRPNMTVIIHHFDTSGSPPYTKLVEYFDFFLLKILSLFCHVRSIFVSQFWAMRFRSKMKLDSYLIFNKPFPDLPPTLCTKSALARKYDLPEEKDWIFLGSTHPKKGGAEVIEAMLRLNTDPDKWDFVFIQTGYSAKLTSVQNRWIQSKDYPDFLRACSLVVANSSFLEGWCRVLHEAAMVGTPVAGSGLGGMGELLALVSDTDKHDLNDIIKLILEPDLRVKPDIYALQAIDVQSSLNLDRWVTSIQ